MLYVSQAQISNPQAAAYLARLCQHWGRAARVLYDGRQGVVLDERSRRILRLQGECLQITLQCYDLAALDALESSVGSQLGGLLLNREQALDWQRCARQQVA